MPIIGRFAPTPSGPLHFGSLVAAVASYCQARSQHGKWLLRIEDIDTPRVVKGAADQIQRDLERFGFEWDEQPLYQSSRLERYQGLIDELFTRGNCYACECSRRSVRHQIEENGLAQSVYPGNCRYKNLPIANHSVRLDTSMANTICFQDLIFGEIRSPLSRQVGDFVIKRADSIHAYHLAVVADDHDQEVNQIVRGADLLESTCQHIYLQRLLCFPQPGYLHLPLAMNNEGIKLSKQCGARALDPEQASSQLVAAFVHLGQPIDRAMQSATAHEVLNWGIKHWSLTALTATATFPFNGGKNA